MGKHYDNAAIPDVLRREFDVYDRIAELGIDLGTFEENVTSLADSPIAHMVFHESGLMYLSGSSGGTYPMNDDEDRIAHGFQGAQEAADHQIRRLHWGLSAGGEGDLNDVLYTVKALGMVVTPRRRNDERGTAGHERIFVPLAVDLRRRQERIRRRRCRPRRLCRRPCTERDGRLRRTVLHRTGDRRRDTREPGDGYHCKPGMGIPSAAGHAGED